MESNPETEPNKILDGIQFGLDIAGLVPGIGEPLDLINAGISLARGKYGEAALSAAAAIPFIGGAATAGKMANKAGQAVLKNLDKADEAVVGLSKLGDEFTDMILNQPCFPAGTPILTPLGHTLIEDLRVGDVVLSRPENDVAASTNWQRVEAVYTRESEVLALHVGGQVIKTTAEHPFWVKDYGWVAAGALEAGDQFSTHGGHWITLDEIHYTGEWTTVYNFRVQEDHTYFVGHADWDLSAWVHNTHSGEFVGQIQKWMKDGMTEAQVRADFGDEIADEVMRRINKKLSGIHDKKKIIDSISKSSDQAKRAAQDLLDGKISADEYEAIISQLDSISTAQRDYFALLKSVLGGWG